MTEVFAKPAAGAIIRRTINGTEHILIQERLKQSDTKDNGLIEIPAGKIREYENIFDGLRREVFEETGLRLVKIEGEEEAAASKCRGCTVISFNPFYSSQNLNGIYSIILQTFICEAEGEPFEKSDESVNIRWIPVEELKELLLTSEDRFFPMHINALKKYIKERAGK